MLTKEQLLAELQPRFETIPVAGLSGPLRAKVMDGFTRSRLQKILKDVGTDDDVYFSAIVRACIVDENGDPYFSDEEIETLRGMNAELVRAIGLECQRVNALGAPAVAEAEKNSEATQNDSSGTA